MRVLLAGVSRLDKSFDAMAAGAETFLISYGSIHRLNPELLRLVRAKAVDSTRQGQRAAPGIDDQAYKLARVHAVQRRARQDDPE